MADYDFSAAAQYAALGRAAAPAARSREMPDPAAMRGLAALGAYVGNADNHPPAFDQPDLEAA